MSDAHAALAHCGIVERRFGHIIGLDDRWRPLWDAVLATGDQSLAPALGRFVRFLNGLGVAPEAVADSEADAYERALELNELRRSPEEARRQAVYGWNLATERITAWPKQRLTQVSRSRRYALPLEAFSRSFQDDVARCLARMAAPDPLDPEGLTAALRPDTIRHRRAQMLRLASAIVHSGTPIETIDGLARIAEPELAKRGLRWMMAHHEGKTMPAIADTAIMLKTIGGFYLKLPATQHDEIAGIARRLAVPPSRGLTSRNRERLRQFDDRAMVGRLLRLPERLLERAEATGPTYRALLDREIAIALAIVMICPIRRKNLAELHLDAISAASGMAASSSSSRSERSRTVGRSSSNCHRGSSR